MKARQRRRPVLVAAVSALLVLSGCGGSDDTVANAQAACPQAPATVSAPEGATTDLSTKPTIDAPGDPPPTMLQVADIVEGQGQVACTGDQVTVKYVGVTYADGTQFDASWDRGENFPFPLGAGQVIPGWDKGLLGMKVGGRRQLTIPSDLAYGDQGAGADIAPGAALIFVVDLVSVQKTSG